MSVRITCINKDNGDHYDQHLAITHFGWVADNGNSGKASLAEMIDFLEKGNTAYVKDSSGKVAVLVVRISVYGNKYVKTVSDGRETDNLLNLSEC